MLIYRVRVRSANVSIDAKLAKLARSPVLTVDQQFNTRNKDRIKTYTALRFKGHSTPTLTRCQKCVQI